VARRSLFYNVSSNHFAVRSMALSAMAWLSVSHLIDVVASRALKWMRASAHDGSSANRSQTRHLGEA
jgi:hypothetical protein